MSRTWQEHAAAVAEVWARPRVGGFPPGTSLAFVAQVAYWHAVNLEGFEGSEVDWYAGDGVRRRIMRELEHEDLFKPPEGVRIVVIPCCGEYWQKPPATMYTPMKEGYAKLAKVKWKKIHINLGVLHWRMGVTPHPLTAEKTIGKNKVKRIYMPGKQKSQLPLRYHLVSLPTRKYASEAINVDFLCQKIHELTKLCDGRIPWLAEGDVVLPQISDPVHNKTWFNFKGYVEPWLHDDRFIIISGKGLAT